LSSYTHLAATVEMLDHSWKPFCESLFSSSVALLMLSAASQKRRPFNSDSSQGEKTQLKPGVGDTPVLSHCSLLENP
jgi:hypothetical protein